MESDWRFNIWAMGMCFSDWRLAARKSGAPFLVIVNEAPSNPGFYRTYNLPTPTSLPVLLGFTAIPAAHPHFPYGVLVLGN